MSVIRRILVSLVALATLTICASAQDGAGNSIFFDALSFAGETEGESRLDLILSVPYTAIDFTREADGFSGKYKVDLHVRLRDELTVFDTTFTRPLRTSDYDKTNGTKNAFDFFQVSIPVPPGEYSASVEILDYGTNLLMREKRNVAVLDFLAYRFSLSGLMLVSRIREKEEGGHAITPLLTENVSLLNDSYFLFFEAYNRTDTDDFILTARYMRTNGDVVWNGKYEKAIGPGTSQQWLRLPLEGIGRGVYVAEIVASRADDPNDTLAAAKRIIAIQGTVEGMPLSEAELIDKVKQLRYAAVQSEMDYIRNAAIFTEKRKRFAEFWAERDPSPGTPLNEAMEEYYRRIDYANEHFRSYEEGWLTDMGRIYVIYGPPDKIDRDPFATDGKPRETWEYFGRRLRLLFIDQTGFDDFRLATPVPLSEKYRY